MEILPAARKHGIKDAEIVHAVEHYLFVADVDDDPSSRVLYIGPDRAGNLLEVITVSRRNDVELVIHAMKMRTHFQELLPRAKGQR